MIIPSFLFKGLFSGIYCIHNTVNNKKYIGSSKNIYNRLHKHRHLLKTNRHENVYLQNAVNKYSLESFEIFILEFVELDNLVVREQYYIDTLSPEYNITKEVIRNTPSIISIEKSKKTTKERREKGMYKCSCCKKIYEHNINGEVINEYESITKASQMLNIHSTSIIRVLQKTHKQVKNKRFSYDGKTLDSFETNKFGKKLTSLGVKVELIDTYTNTFHIFASKRKAAEFMNVTPASVSYFSKKQTLCKQRYKILPRKN